MKKEEAQEILKMLETIDDDLAECPACGFEFYVDDWGGTQCPACGDKA